MLFLLPHHIINRLIHRHHYITPYKPALSLWFSVLFHLLLKYNKILMGLENALKMSPLLFAFSVHSFRIRNSLGIFRRTNPSTPA